MKFCLTSKGQQAVASALEAYPLDADLTPSASSTGYAATFARAGFKEVAHYVPPRPIMRYDLRGEKLGCLGIVPRVEVCSAELS